MQPCGIPITYGYPERTGRHPLQQRRCMRTWMQSIPHLWSCRQHRRSLLNRMELWISRLCCVGWTASHWDALDTSCCFSFQYPASNSRKNAMSVHNVADLHKHTVELVTTRTWIILFDRTRQAHIHLRIGKHRNSSTLLSYTLLISKQYYIRKTWQTDNKKRKINKYWVTGRDGFLNPFILLVNIHPCNDPSRKLYSITNF